MPTSMHRPWAGCLAIFANVRRDKAEHDVSLQFHKHKRKTAHLTTVQVRLWAPVILNSCPQTLTHAWQTSAEYLYK